MEFSRIQIILIIGLMAYAVRALPQVFFIGDSLAFDASRQSRIVDILTQGFASERRTTGKRGKPNGDCGWRLVNF